MKIFIEFKFDIIRVKINYTEKHFQLPHDFYSYDENDKSLRMFNDEIINSKIKHFIKSETEKLNFLNRFENLFFGNEVISLIDNSIENLVSVDQMYAYSTIFFTGRKVYIIIKPKNFNSEDLNDVELIKKFSAN